MSTVATGDDTTDGMTPGVDALVPTCSRPSMNAKVLKPVDALSDNRYAGWVI